MASGVRDSASTMSSAISEADNYVAWIVDSFRPFIGSDMLEIGTGFGNYRRFFPDIGRYSGVDIDPASVTRAAEGDPAGFYRVADIARDDLRVAFGGRTFDTILCANVLEHVAAEGAALDHMLAALRPGGHLLLLVPAHPALFTDMDRLAGHLRRYTIGSLRAAVRGRAGTVVMARHFNSIGAVGWWANGLRRYDDLDDAAINRQIAFFDRWIVPLSRAVDPLTRGFFGQSLLMAVRR
jgi:SAM-dependent methyltransferase